MLDLKLYNVDGTTEEDPMSLAVPSSASSTGLEVIAGKVVKFLLTEYGSDAFEPTYGGIALHHNQMAKSYMQKFKLEMLDDLDRCVAYIREAEESLPATDTTLTDRLEGLDLLAASYSDDDKTVYVKISMRTANGNYALLSISNDTNS